MQESHRLGKLLGIAVPERHSVHVRGVTHIFIHIYIHTHLYIFLYILGWGPEPFPLLLSRISEIFF